MGTTTVADGWLHLSRASPGWPDGVGFAHLVEQRHAAAHGLQASA